jgi:branched-subunit amino acid aminotransferase/4-amino-4-deoxychorismate lyase
MAYHGENARVRVDVLERPATRWPVDSRLLLTLAPFSSVPQRHYDSGVRVGLARQLHREQPLAKRADFILARRDYPLGRPEAYDYLLLDEEEHILEGSSSNFYVVCDSVLWTAGDGVLEGITRKIVLEQLAPALDLPVRLQAPALASVESFDEAFLSSSSRGLIPVVNIAGFPLGTEQPGPITRRLMGAYNDYVAEAITPAV